MNTPHPTQARPFIKTLFVLWLVIVLPLLAGAPSSRAAGMDAAQAAVDTIDYAQAAQRDDWLRHPVLGDPSCDAFERIGGPVVSGMPGLEWPVNGTLLVDPKDGAWYLFAARYPKDYALRPPPHHIQCAVYRARDRGKSWENLGPPWPEAEFHLDGVKPPLTHAADMAACFADGRYHFVYDWVSADTSWATVYTPPPSGTGNDSGVGYAWAESPSGPWHRTPRPLRMNSQVSRAPLLGKYRRAYGPTLLRRKHDWLLLTAMDSSPFHAWALVGATASRPEGPYSEAVPLLHTEDARYLPAVVEFFPAFVHDGTAYAPATALAANRNHQVLFAASLEQAHLPDAWRVAQEGAFWHAEDTPAEARGLWGQTPGCTVQDGELLALFPTRNREGLGHLGVARRSWQQPFRDGLVLSGHEAPAPAPLRWSYDAFRLDALVTPRGRCALLWAWTPAVGYDAIPGWRPHAQCLRRCQALDLDDTAWRVVLIDAQGARQTIAEGQRQPGSVAIKIERTTNGATSITLAGRRVWQGQLPTGGGALGLLAAEWSHLRVERLAVSGERRPATDWYVAEDAFHGAGGNAAEWTVSRHSGFHFGSGLVHQGDGGRAKWNVQASALTLWAPSGPDGVAYAVELDGTAVATVDTRTKDTNPSAPVWRSGPIPYGPHTLVLRAQRGPLVVDALEAVVR